MRSWPICCRPPEQRLWKGHVGAARPPRLDRRPGAKSFSTATRRPALLRSSLPKSSSTSQTTALIDEWQLVPDVWNLVRRAVDDTGGLPGQFILTGSAVPPDDVTRHSGALRFGRLRMRPLSLTEAGYSTGDISLVALMSGDEPRAGDTGMTINEIADRIAIGGWPALQDRTVDQALLALRGYLRDTSRLDSPSGWRPARPRECRSDRVMRSLARNVATEASARAIAADVGGADGPVDYHTVIDYTAALKRVFVIEDLPSWSPSLRSRSILRASMTRHFVDPSLAVAALNTRPERLLQDVETMGLLFESLVVRDLRIYAQAIDGDVSHYRDNLGLEADAIIECRDGRWAAIEVKLGHGAIDIAAENLLRLAAKIDTDRHGEPAFLAVVTGWGYGYRRPDGVSVISIGALAP